MLRSPTQEEVNDASAIVLGTIDEFIQTHNVDEILTNAEDYGDSAITMTILGYSDAAGFLARISARLAYAAFPSFTFTDDVNRYED